MTKSQINYSALLTPEIEAQMPKGLTGVDAMNWRKRKMKELVEQGYTGIDGNVPRFEDTAKTSESTESAEMTEDKIENDSVEEEIVSSEENESDESDGSDIISLGFEQMEQTEQIEAEQIEQAEPENSVVAYSKKPSSKKTKKRVSKTTSVGYEFARNIPCSVMDALRRQFATNASKVDLISAAVYIFTDGDCEISDNAMQIVKAYKAEDKQFDLTQRTETRLANIERMLREQRDMMQSVELCTCYNTFDRRYGSKEPRRAPKDTEFREQGNLDMLARLRKQAKDQRMIDDVEKGRAIYNQTKDEND